MQSEDDVRETMEHAETMYERMDENDNHIEAIGTKIIQHTLSWVLEEDDADSLLQDLREDVKETEDGEIEL